MGGIQVESINVFSHLAVKNGGSTMNVLDLISGIFFGGFCFFIILVVAKSWVDCGSDHEKEGLE